MAHTESIKNFALAGHGGTGKTTFFESLLFAGKAIPKPELVGSGKTAGASGPDEIERGISIRAALASFEYGTDKPVKINIIDTPGAADFTGEVILAFRSSEFAALLVDGRAGVQIESIKLWRNLEGRKKPRCIIVSKMDDKSADFDKTLADIKEKFKLEPIPVSIPMQGGVIDCLREKAYLAGGEGALEKEVPIPAEYKEAFTNARIKLIEAAADGDEILTEKYILLGSLEPEEVYTGLKEALVERKYLPVFASAALKNSGAQPVLDFLAVVAPGADSGRDIVRSGEEEKEIPVHPDAPLSALVIKTIYDQFSGKLSWVKVITGALKNDQEFSNITEGKKEKAGKLYTAVGKKLIEVKELAAGDIGIIAKAASLKTNDTIAASADALPFLPLRLPLPVYSLAVSAAAKKDDDKLGDFFVRCAEEDKTFSYAFNAETKETVISGMGELHLNILLDAAKKTQKLELETRTPRVAYRETITKKSAAEYTHKKQTGGHGQFGRVALEIAPLPRGEQYKFTNAIFGGAVSKGYIPGVEKGIHEAMDRGTVAGYPVVDVESKIVDGKEHPVDSSELAFKLAARNAFREAMKQANPTLLEPVMKLTVFAEQKYTGDIMSGVSGKRGKVLGQDSIGGGIDEIRALVPHAELLRYAIELRSITSGTASFSLEFDHYAPISGKVAEDVIKAAEAFKIEKESEE